jgi:hypothetical protein
MAIKMAYSAPRPAARKPKPNMEAAPRHDPPTSPEEWMYATIWFRSEDEKIVTGVEYHDGSWFEELEDEYYDFK